jgi:hypothetical protein
VDIAAIARESAEDIRLLLAIACIGDSPSEAEGYKSVFQANLERLDKLAEGE